MLRHKKGVYSLAITAGPALFAILIILGFFTAYFFVYGAAYSSEVVISANDFPPSIKLPLLLNSNISSEKTLKDIIVSVYIGNADKKELTSAISEFSEKVVIKPLPKNTLVSYNLRAYTLPDKTPIPELSAESEKIFTPLQSEYYNEFQVLPLPDGKSIVIELYLYCTTSLGTACDNSYIQEYA